jgi:DNA ligase-1
MVTGNAAISALTDFLANCTDREYKWYLKVIQRDLKIGITDKTINKVFKGLVPQFTCALANSWEPKKTPKRFVADTKMDGYRCLVFNYPDRVELRSRNGHPLEGFVGIEADYRNYMPEGFVFDGEITSRSNSFADMQKSAFKKGEADKDGIHHVFDVVSIEEFEKNEFKVPYEQRLELLNQLNPTLEGARSLARVYPSEPLTNTEEGMARLFEIHAKNVEKDEEGTMIKNLDAVYKMDKSNNILKVKDFYEIDLVVTGVYEGKEGTQFQGTMGGVTVELSDKDVEEQLPINDPKHTKKLPYVKDCVNEVGVGSGWDISDRVMYWSNPNLLIGKTIQIQFQNITINDDGKHSLRFPTIVKIRNDK